MKFCSFFLSLLFLAACAASTPHSASIKKNDRDIISIADGCEYHYDPAKRIVAVVPFTNSASVRGAKINDRTNIDKEIDERLPAFAQSAVESALVSLGGATVVSRAQLEQVLNEQTFQMTLADPDTVVEFGLLTGAEYIIAGSVDSVTYTYISKVSTDYDTNNLFGILIALGSSIYNSSNSGWQVDTRYTVNIIDVSTAKIIAGHSSSGSQFIGDTEYLSSSQAVGGAQAAMNNGMQATVDFINREFSPMAHVNELRGNKKLALINMGSRDGVRDGDVFNLQVADSYKDFRTGKATCTMSDSKVNYIATEHIGVDYAWLEDYSGLFTSNPIKIGSLMKRVSAKR